MRVCVCVCMCVGGCVCARARKCVYNLQTCTDSNRTPPCLQGDNPHEIPERIIGAIRIHRLAPSKELGMYDEPTPPPKTRGKRAGGRKMGDAHLGDDEEDDEAGR